MEEIKDPMKHLKMKPTMCEMKNTLKRINGRLDIAKEKIIALENITVETRFLIIKQKIIIVIIIIEQQQ